MSTLASELIVAITFGVVMVILAVIGIFQGAPRWAQQAASRGCKFHCQPVDPLRSTLTVAPAGADPENQATSLGPNLSGRIFELQTNATNAGNLPGQSITPRLEQYRRGNSIDQNGTSSQDQDSPSCTADIEQTSLPRNAEPDITVVIEEENTKYYHDRNVSVYEQQPQHGSSAACDLDRLRTALYDPGFGSLQHRRCSVRTIIFSAED